MVSSNRRTTPFSSLCKHTLRCLHLSFEIHLIHMRHARKVCGFYTYISKREHRGKQSYRQTDMHTCTQMHTHTHRHTLAHLPAYLPTYVPTYVASTYVRTSKAMVSQAAQHFLRPWLLAVQDCSPCCVSDTPTYVHVISVCTCVCIYIYICCYVYIIYILIILYIYIVR